MKLKCLGSSSSGNCYLLIGEKETLIIEAGVKFSKVKEALSFDLSNVVGCILSHEHGDHAKYASEMQSAGIEIIGTVGTLVKCIDTHINSCIIFYRVAAAFGGFTITTYQTIHDAEEPCAFLIEHPEIGRMLFITDTASFKYEFKGINHLMIEANYDDDIVNENNINNPNAFNNIERLQESHMSIKECEFTCGYNVYSGTKSIILIHLSGGNSDTQLFKDTIKRKTGKPVYVANENFEIEL